MGGGAEPHQAEILTVFQPGQAQGPITDGSGAEQGCASPSVEERRNGMGEVFRDHGVFGIAAVGIPAVALNAEHKFSFPPGRNRTCPQAE